MSNAEELIDEQGAIQSALFEWHAAHPRDVPWRASTDPYAILVAEVMSQQTQIDRVIPAWRAFVERWPTPASLAGADRSAVITFWSQHRLGYNRRAEYLHTAARHIVDEWDGRLPRDVSCLQGLRGVGPYTANAVASLAFNAGGPTLDTNVKRVLFRASGADPSEEPPYDELGRTLMPSDAPAAWNNAMMDLGATVCTPSPRCDDEPCPLRPWCGAYQRGTFEAPEIPSQGRYEGSDRQFRGRILRALSERGSMDVLTLGAHIRETFDAADEDDRAWVETLVAGLREDRLIAIEETEIGRLTVRLADDAAQS